MEHAMPESTRIDRDAEAVNLRRRRSGGRALNPNAWLEPLVGAGVSEGPTDASERKHDYLADAIYKETLKQQPS
jgi:hypothetical protein